MRFLWILIAILVVFWLLGAFALRITNWFLHLLLVAAVILLLVRLFRRAPAV